MDFSIDAIEQSARNTFDVIVGHHDAGTDEHGAKKLGDPVGFRVLGTGSEEYQTADRQIQLLNVKEAAMRKEKVDLTKDDGAQVIVDGSEKRRMLIVNACVVGWFGFKDANGDAPFTRDNLHRVLKAKPNWLRQILAAIEDEGNFAAG